MKILMLVNWRVAYCDEAPADKQPPDYSVKGEDYWFFRHFREKPEVDVLDIRSFPWLEKFEKNKLHFYIWQALRAIPKLPRYDLILSHGMQSAAVVCLWRRLFLTRAKHIVFDIGSFASGAESGMALKMMRFVSKSLDGLIYHTSSQKEYYHRFFPWIEEKAKFIRFGADFDFFTQGGTGGDVADGETRPYIVCAGRSKCDWETTVAAFRATGLDMDLHLIGGREERFAGIPGVWQYPLLPVDAFMEQVRRATFCVLPLEPLPFSFGQMRLLQQMALKKCVIVSNAPSVRDYVRDGETAFVYSPGDTETLTRLMCRLAQNPTERERVAAAAQVFVRTKCNERLMAQEIEAYIETVLARG